MSGSGRPRTVAVVLSCEHGGNRVPERYQALFQGGEAQSALRSHRGWDPGSLRIGRAFQRYLRAPLTVSLTSRLLVDLNRSPGHPKLFSPWTRPLPPGERQRILNRYYLPHRRRVEADVRAAIKAGQAVFHLSVHTFTPVMNHVRRTTDVGLLFDPGRRLEQIFSRAWQRHLRQGDPALVVHLNRPYRGTSDGLTTLYRQQFPEDRYFGVELEVNQRFAVPPAAPLRPLTRWLIETFAATLDNLSGTLVDAGSISSP